MRDDIVITNPEDFENDGWTGDPELDALLAEIDEQDARESRFPEKRWYGEIDREVLLAEGRAEFGHPGTWKPEAEPVEPEEPEIPLCSKRIHQMVGNNIDGRQCRACKAVWQKRKRSADRGKPLCWTATHPEPAPGEICECGDVPPPDDFIDWALVENAVVGRELCRPLTNAEQVCALQTVTVRYEEVSGAYEARTWLREFTDVRISERRVEYLYDEWLPGNDLKAMSAGEIFLRDMREAARQEESHRAA